METSKKHFVLFGPCYILNKAITFVDVTYYFEFMVRDMMLWQTRLEFATAEASAALFICSNRPKENRHGNLLILIIIRNRRPRK